MRWVWSRLWSVQVPEASQGALRDVARDHGVSEEILDQALDYRAMARCLTATGSDGPPHRPAGLRARSPLPGLVRWAARRPELSWGGPKVDFSGPNATPGTGQARFLRYHPFGLPIDNNNSRSCYTPPVAGGPSCNPLSRTVTNPQAGVWEVTVDARRTSDAVETPYTLTASILGASVSPNPDIVPAATIGVPVARSYTLTNLFGAFTGRAVGTTRGSARRGVFSIANFETQQYPVAVTAGSTSLRATIAARRIRRPTSTSSSSTARAGPVCSPGRAPTETPRSP